MIIYNITTMANTDIADDWINWMQNEHIPDVMATGLFTAFKFCRLIGMDQTDALTYTTQFSCKSMSVMHQYETQYAADLRAKTQARYSDKLVSFRTLMEVVYQNE